MAKLNPCSACGLPFRDDWIKLADTARYGARFPTYLCPRCTMGHTGPRNRNADTRADYFSRVHATHEDYALPESDSGDVELPTPRLDADALRRRTEFALEILKLQSTMRKDAQADARCPRVLHVGAKTGDLLACIAEFVDIEGVGLEVHEPFAAVADARQVPCGRTTLEALDASSDGHFDLILEHYLLEHLQQPRAHLKAIAKKLRPDGLAVIEVPNLCQAMGSLEHHFLQRCHPNVFTPHALVTMCSHAGLAPVSMLAGEDLVIVCRKIRPEARNDESRRIFPGPDAKTVATAARANDLRLTIKRGFARAGATPAMLSLAQRAFEECNWSPGRADLALEIANALERSGHLRDSAKWLRHSLDERPDVDVENMLVQIEQILSANATGERVPERRAAVARTKNLFDTWTLPRPDAALRLN